MTVPERVAEVSFPFPICSLFVSPFPSLSPSLSPSLTFLSLFPSPSFFLPFPLSLSPSFPLSFSSSPPLPPLFPPSLSLSLPPPSPYSPFFIFPPSQMNRILDDKTLFNECPDVRFHNKSLREHLEDPFFGVYTGITGRHLLLEYLRWLTARGELPANLSALLKAEEERFNAGTFRFCVCAFFFAAVPGFCLPLLSLRLWLCWVLSSDFNILSPNNNRSP